MEPISSVVAGTIVKLAFDEFVKSGAGEVAKRSVGGAIDLVKNLQGKIKARFQGDARAEKAIQAIEQEQSQPALVKLETYLDDAMEEDEAFASEIRQLAQQIINIQNQTNQGDRTYHQTAGRDIWNIETIEGDSHKFGGS